MPVTFPVTGSTVAIAPLPVNQVPPLLPVVLNKVDVLTQIFCDPEIVPAIAPGFTVKVK